MLNFENKIIGGSQCCRDGRDWTHNMEHKHAFARNMLDVNTINIGLACTLQVNLDVTNPSIQLTVFYT